MSGRITAVSLEFNQCFSSFASKSYDVLDPDDESFKEDFLKFQDRILELDMKLAAILCQAFDDSHNLESVFKLISIVIISIFLFEKKNNHNLFWGGNGFATSKNKGRIYLQIPGNSSNARWWNVSNRVFSGKQHWKLSHPDYFLVPFVKGFTKNRLRSTELKEHWM